ncbi:MAG TPA: aldo/keto reductase [Firmicutes bacterium]|nr:aldo/keto reductase [Bacillota bacterium]
MLKSTVKVLHNGVKMPMLGFGTFKVEDGQVTVDSVKAALELGCRHIDGAAVYGNEISVGQGIKESGVAREEVFVTSKVWNSEQGYEKTLAAFDKTLADLGLEYLDLYLIHWPKPLNNETWKAMEELYKSGRVRAIGVSNFKEHHLEDLMANAEIMPLVNQIELHPQLAQPELLAFCDKHNIAVTAWGPLMQGQIFDIELMKQLAEKYNKSISQLALRWSLQRGVISIPKSIKPHRIAENFNIFDFEITDEDMLAIAELNTGERVGPDPDTITF